MTMRKSGRKRRQEIKARRRALALSNTDVDVYVLPDKLPQGAVLADPAQLIHDNSYCRRPLFYVDRPFTCKDCGTHEVWTAKQQKWWYEVAKGLLGSIAVRCRPCRSQRQSAKAEARRVHLDGIARKAQKNA